MCQAAAAITSGTPLTPWKSSDGCAGGSGRAGGTTSLGYPSLKAAQELWVFWLCPTADTREGGKEGSVPASFGSFGFHSSPPQSLRAVSFSKVLKWRWQSKDARNEEIHMGKSAEFIEKVTILIKFLLPHDVQLVNHGTPLQGELYWWGSSWNLWRFPAKVFTLTSRNGFLGGYVVHSPHSYSIFWDVPIYAIFEKFC